MERTPLFPGLGEHDNMEGLLRNFWCPHYDECLDIAAGRNRHLVCTSCAFRETREPDLFFRSNLP